jgi:hypothetical protein
VKNGCGRRYRVIVMTKYNVPADVPNELQDLYIQNMDKATAGTGRMNLFACDQKIEHLNDDFYDGGKNIPLSSKLVKLLLLQEQSEFWQGNLD